MKILVVGEAVHFDECRQKFAHHLVSHAPSPEMAETLLEEVNVIFDFNLAARPQSFAFYAAKPLPVFLNASFMTLSSLALHYQGAMECTIFGFNGLPSLFNRTRLEVSLPGPENLQRLGEICSSLGTQFFLVEDRVGLVTPRVICMIVNEAYYTVLEGTATRKDIDLAMKLGTNYPYGPFEWCERIGIQNVYRLLNAVYEETKDERYKICSLLEYEYLQTEISGI